MDFDQVLANPAAAFKRPADVCEAAGLTREQKIHILRQWEYDARELEVAEEENMPGGPPDLLADILAALGSLEGASQQSISPTKQGGD